MSILNTIFRNVNNGGDIVWIQGTNQTVTNDGNLVRQVVANTSRATGANQQIVSTFNVDEVNCNYKLFIQNTVVTATTNVWVNGVLISTITGLTNTPVFFTSSTFHTATDPAVAQPCIVFIQHSNTAIYAANASLFNMSVSLLLNASLFVETDEWKLLPGIAPEIGDSGTITTTGYTVIMAPRQVVAGKPILPMTNGFIKRPFNYTLSSSDSTIPGSTGSVTEANILAPISWPTTTKVAGVTFSLAIDPLTNIAPNTTYVGAHLFMQ